MRGPGEVGEGEAKGGPTLALTLNLTLTLTLTLTLLSEPTPAGQKPGWKMALMLSVCWTKLAPSNAPPLAANSTRCASSRYVHAKSNSAAFSAAAYLLRVGVERRSEAGLGGIVGRAGMNVHGPVDSGRTHVAAQRGGRPRRQ